MGKYWLARLLKISRFICLVNRDAFYSRHFAGRWDRQLSTFTDIHSHKGITEELAYIQAVSGTAGCSTTNAFQIR